MKRYKSIKELINYINLDFYRKAKITKFQKLIRFLTDESLIYLFYLKYDKFFKNKFVFYLFKFLHLKLGKKYGVKIPIETEIGYELHINNKWEVE